MSGQKVAFVALASLSDPGLMPTFVANALGMRGKSAPDASTLVEAIVDWLNTNDFLLVLDNCEHLVEAAATIAFALLEGCPNLRILAKTARQRLGLTGEVAWRVPSLPVPEKEKLPANPADAVATALAFPSIRLFVERAAAARQGFRLTRPEDADAVCRICHRLDGIPLAIELAAARVSSLTLEDIHARLDQRFRLLTGGSRAALPRQQTLRSLIDWSYDLLNEAEKALLCRLAVFSGGWTLAAAETVCGQDRMTLPGPNLTDCDLPSHDVLDSLTSLTDKSLIVAETFLWRNAYATACWSRFACMRVSALTSTWHANRNETQALRLLSKVGRRCGIEFWKYGTDGP